jgi:hypothetical protein
VAYAIEGDWGNAGISTVGMVPLFGDAAKIERIGVKVAGKLDNAAQVIHKLERGDACFLMLMKLKMFTTGLVILQVYELRMDGQTLDVRSQNMLR